MGEKAKTAAGFDGNPSDRPELAATTSNASKHGGEVGRGEGEQVWTCVEAKPVW